MAGSPRYDLTVPSKTDIPHIGHHGKHCVSDDLTSCREMGPAPEPHKGPFGEGFPLS
jgi:hypothetical protein